MCFNNKKHIDKLIKQMKAKVSSQREEFFSLLYFVAWRLRNRFINRILTASVMME